jgi:hypothetical protein
MTDYIRREDALYAIQRQRGATRSPAQNRLLDLLKVDIVRAPAADVAEVVRCKDCKHRTEYGNCGHPRQKGVLPSAYPLDFCNYGDAE